MPDLRLVIILKNKCFFQGHFGPINSMAWHPDGNIIATGGEDGYVRIQTFDDDYLEFKYDY